MVPVGLVPEPVTVVGQTGSSRTRPAGEADRIMGPMGGSPNPRVTAAQVGVPCRGGQRTLQCSCQ